MNVLARLVNKFNNHWTFLNYGDELLFRMDSVMIASLFRRKKLLYF